MRATVKSSHSFATSPAVARYKRSNGAYTAKEDAPLLLLGKAVVTTIGARLGSPMGACLGTAVGDGKTMASTRVGCEVAASVGVTLAPLVGNAEALFAFGFSEGTREGIDDTVVVGTSEGVFIGERDGIDEGVSDKATRPVGTSEGSEIGKEEGIKEGESD